jgi:hypothetical protein
MTLREKIDAAIENSRPQEASELLDQQKLDALSSWFKVKAQGGDPLSQVTPEGMFTHPEVQLGIAAVEMQQQQSRIQEALDMSGWYESVQPYHMGLVEKLRARKEASRDEDPGPLVEDPNELANARQALVKANNAVREASNGRLTIWDLPQTRETAMALGTETQGMAVSGEQQMDLGVVGTAGQAVMEAVEGAVDPLIHLGMGGVQLATMGLDSLLGGNGAYVFEPPTKIIRDPQTGELLTDSGKVAGIADMMVATWAAATGRKVEDEVANLNAGAEYEEASRSGFQSLVLGSAHVAGMFSPVGYVGIAGKAMHGGQALGRGLAHVAANGSKYGKHIRAIAETAGAMVANGALEATMRGNIEGYGRSFMGGMWMGLPLLTIGAMGKRTEWFLRNRQNMPARVAATVGGIVEGAGFGVLETTTTDSLWEFLKTGDKEAFQSVFMSFAQNMIGAGIAKGVQRPSAAPPTAVGDLSPQATETLQAARMERKAAPSAELPRTIEAEKAAERTVAVEEQGLHRTETERRAEKFIAKKPWGEGKEAAPEVAAKGAENMAADVEAIKSRLTKGGLRGEELQRRQDEPRTPEEFSKKATELRDEVRKLRMQPYSREKTLRIIELIEQNRGMLTASRASMETQRLEPLVKFRQGAVEGKQLGYQPEPAKAEAIRQQAELAKEAKMEEAMAAMEAEAIEALPAEVRPEVKESIRRTETVEGAEGRPIVGERAYPGEKRGPKQHKPPRLSPEEMMRQEGGREGLDPDIIQHKPSREVEKEARQAKEQGFDPLEEVTFMERPEAERRSILERREAQERRKTAEGFEGPDARTGADRRKFNRREWERLRELEGDVPRGTSEEFASQGARFERLPTETKEGAKLVRMSDIRLEMEGFPGDPIRVSIRPGRIAIKFATGLANIREDLIRTKDDFDTATLAHEWAHVMQGKTVGFRYRWPDSIVNAELLKIGAPVAGRATGVKAIAEGFAEFWARHALGDPQLKAEAPNAYRALTEWLASPSMSGYARQYGRIQGAIQSWKDIGALGRHTMLMEAGGKPSEQEIKAGLKGKKAGVLKAARAIGQSMLDDVTNFKSRETYYLKRAGIDPANVPISQTPSRVYDLYRMRTRSVAEQFLRTGTSDLFGKRTGAGLEDVLSKVSKDELPDFLNYMLAVKSLDLAAKGQKTILPVEDHLAVVEKLDRPEWRDTAEQVTGYFHRLLNYTVEAGVRTEAEAVQIRDNMGIWLPMLKTVSGNIKDPIQAMADITSSMVARAHDAMVRKAMVMQSVRLKGQGGFVSEVPRKAVPQHFQVKELMKAIERADVPAGKVRELNEVVELLESVVDKDVAESIATLFRPELLPKEGESIIAHKVAFTEKEIAAETDRYTKRWMKENNGKELFFQMDKIAHEALLGLEDPHIALFGSLPEGMQRIVRAPAQAVKFGATLTSPGFQVAALIKDVVTYGAYTKSDAGFIPFSGIGAALQGIKHMVTKSADYKRFIALGGAGETLIANELFGGKARAALHSARHPVTVARNLARQAIKVLNSGDQILRIRESAAVYEKAIREGKSELDATLESMEAGREITVNYVRGGTLGRAVNQVSAYFNAGVQGNRKMWRTMLGADGGRVQAQIITQALASITSLTALNYLFHGDEEWYQDLPEWRRNGYWNFRNPFDGKPISIPKPFALGQLFSVPFEMGLDAMSDRDPVSMKNFLADFVGSQVGGWAMVPSIALPSVEVAANYSFFRDSPILPFWSEAAKLPKDQYTAHTTQVARWLGESFGVSPAKLEHWIGGTTGGLSTRVFRNIDWMTGASKQPRASLESIPGIGKLFEHSEFEQSRSVDQVYQLSKELQQKAGSKELTYKEKFQRARVERAKKSISAIRAAAKAGKISQDEANRQTAKIAKDALK